MDSDMVISIATRGLPEAGDDYAARKEGENKKRKHQLGMDSDSGPAISDDAAGFRGVSTWSWESMAPCLAVIPGVRSTNENELIFVSHDGKHHMTMPGSNIDLRYSAVNNKDGWIVFVLGNGEVVLFNPVTGAHQEPFTTPIHNYLEDIDDVFLTNTDTDTMIAIAAHWTGDGGLILAVATAGDDGWYVKEFPSKYKFFGITDIVFHDADRKFYAMDRGGKLLSFSLLRCDGNKTTAVTNFFFLSNREDSHHGRLHLVSVGSNLLQVSSQVSGHFDISKYCPEADTWIEMTPTNNIDFGNNALFLDDYGARLVPLPQGEGGVEEGKLRRNCIYSIYHEKLPCPQEDIDKKIYQVELQRVKIEEEAGYVYVPNFGHCGDEEEEIEVLFDTRPKIYDVSKGTLEPYFSTDIQSSELISPQIMWFMPSLPVNN